jgi:transposase
MRLTAWPRQKGGGVTRAYEWFLGLDWGYAAHEICVLNRDGTVVSTRSVPHTVDAVRDAVQWVRAQTGATPDAIAVAIETPRGVLVDTLLEHGFSIFALNPKQLDRFRDRFTAAGAKDDRRDAHALADGLRTDPRAFHHVRADDPTVIHLRELCRMVDDLQDEERRLANRLRQQLYRVNAPWLALNPGADDPWLWTILASAPHPDAWGTLARRHVTAALRAHRIRRWTVDDVVQVLQHPRLTAARGVADAVAARIASLVPQLRLVHEQRVQTERDMDRLLAQLAAGSPEDEPQEHRDVEILLSLPGVGRMVAATMLTEAVAPMGARDYDRLRAYTGVAPVTKRSGKRAYVVHMRYACNPRLRQALYHWTRNSIQLDVTARHYYQHLRAKGHGHARALRSLADRWLRILVAMLQHRTLYDASRCHRIFATP